MLAVNQAQRGQFKTDIPALVNQMGRVPALDAWRLLARYKE